MNGANSGRSQRAPAASIRVVEAIARQKDVDPVELTPPLATVVDPQALDRLCQSDSCEVEFSYGGYRITVSRDDVSLDAPDEG